MSGHTEVAAHILLDIFLLLCTLLLLNLLIAFLTDAYSQVSENKDKAFALANAEAVVELAEQARNSIRCAPSRRYLALSNAPASHMAGSWRLAPRAVECAADVGGCQQRYALNVSQCSPRAD